MVDFFQNGVITTLQRLVDRPVEDLEEELKGLTKTRHTVLLLPALYSEFEGVAMTRIVEQLKGLRYLYRIVLSLDRATEEEFKRVKEIMSVLPGEVRIVWHDGPRMRKLLKELKKTDFNVDMPGKGRSVWMTLGYITADDHVFAIALHDCDIVNYRRDIVSKLVYPIVHPGTDFEFSKGYYARVTDKLYGRVTRLFYTPLIRSLKRILGFNAFLEYLDSFRYPLSGEFALNRSLAEKVRISPTWGLEVSLLSDIYQNTSVNRTCQVEIIETYEHKHQILHKDKPDVGLTRMATEIAEALFKVLSQDGLVMGEGFFRTLVMTYIQESTIAVEKYNAISLLNGLAYDRHNEIQAVEIFTGSLKKAIKGFTENPVGVPLMAAWVRIHAAIPDFTKRLQEAVEIDNQ
ncbi:MAG: glycosyl transferase [Deltaproteobacteria bacterium RBG_13_52_11b]|nr:MAG: glycosyl transferase [Deltaproteobacteria bacterium RBG_13_52_11b]